MLKYFTQYPDRLWWLDGGGALISALSLGILLPLVQSYIGMPVKVLYFLAVFPCLFMGYDAISYCRPRAEWPGWFRGIAIANGLYCLLSIGLLVFHFAELTWLGACYFTVECGLVGWLSVLEWRTASQLLV